MEGQYHIGGDEWKNVEGYALIVNGPSLTYALKRKLERTFLDIGCLCRVSIGHSCSTCLYHMIGHIYIFILYYSR